MLQYETGSKLLREVITLKPKVCPYKMSSRLTVGKTLLAKLNN